MIRNRCSPEAIKFAGYYRDQPGQDYANARYYSATTGGFWSPDPGGMKTADPTSPNNWNRYAYVSGDPINFRDPFGMVQCKSDVCDEDLCDYDWYMVGCPGDSGSGEWRGQRSRRRSGSGGRRRKHSRFFRWFLASL